ncbi:MAG TPA: hypothetical protein VF316_22395, partial [Polyangiaceae bacterium]
ARRAPQDGTISGRLYFDRNGNGTWDSGEPAVSGVRVRSGGREGKTDREGRFVIRRVPSGVLDVRVVNEDVPAGFALEETPVVRLEPGSERAVDLRLHAPRPPQRLGDFRRVALWEGRSDLLDLFGVAQRGPFDAGSLLLGRLVGEVLDAPDMRLLVVGRGRDFRSALDRARTAARLLAGQIPSARIVWTVEERKAPSDIDVSLVRVRGPHGWMAPGDGPVGFALLRPSAR